MQFHRSLLLAFACAVAGCNNSQRESVVERPIQEKRKSLSWEVDDLGIAINSTFSEPSLTFPDDESSLYSAIEEDLSLKIVNGDDSAELHCDFLSAELADDGNATVFISSKAASLDKTLDAAEDVADCLSIPVNKLLEWRKSAGHLEVDPVIAESVKTENAEYRIEIRPSLQKNSWRIILTINSQCDEGSVHEFFNKPRRDGARSVPSPGRE